MCCKKTHFLAFISLRNRLVRIGNFFLFYCKFPVDGRDQVTNEFDFVTFM